MDYPFSYGDAMAEQYSAGASDGLMDGVDLAQHGKASSDNDMASIHLAMAYVLGALGLLWFLGAGYFRQVNR